MITISLVMIVKNESKVIERCLRSVSPYIDTYCICDTGSTDGTQSIIKTYFDQLNIKGQILEHPWKNFGYNRTLAVEAARGEIPGRVGSTADFLLLMDADFIFIIKDPTFKTKSYKADSLLIKYEGQLDYRQPLMVRANLDWKYIGVTHEYIHCPKATRVICDDFIFQHVGDGANKSDKFVRDIQLLTDGIKEEPNNMRYYFYLAQSHKDLASQIKQDYMTKKNTIENLLKQQTISMKAIESSSTDKEKIQKELDIRQKLMEKIQLQLNSLELDFKSHYNLAIQAYEKRIQQHDFPEEVYYATYMLGFCHYHLGSLPYTYTGYFLQAYVYRPQRLESLYNLIKYYRMNQKYNIAYDLGIRPSKQDYPKNDCLFIESRIHTYLFKHEIAISAFYLGKYQECIDLINEILKVPDLPENHRQLVTQHKETAQQKLLPIPTNIKSSTNPQHSLANPRHSLANPQHSLANPQHSLANPRHSLANPRHSLANPRHSLANPRQITFFSYNLLGTGGSEISDWGLLKYLSKENGYIIKHSRDYREIIQDRPAIILAQQFAIKKGVELAAELNIPIIITQHGHNQWDHASLNNYFIFNSNYVANDEIVKADFKYYDIVYPRIDIQKFKPIGMNVDYTQRKFITFIGRPDKIKGIDLFMQLATVLTNMSFLFVGGQPKDLIIPNNVEVRNFTFQPELVYAESRLVLVPSQYEPFGMVTVEASFCGVPVISTSLPGLEEATSNLSNYVDSFDNIELWINMINKVLNDYDNQCQIAYNIAIEYERKHSIQLNKFKSNVERLIEGKEPIPFNEIDLNSKTNI